MARTFCKQKNVSPTAGGAGVHLRARRMEEFQVALIGVMLASPTGNVEGEGAIVSRQ